MRKVCAAWMVLAFGAPCGYEAAPGDFKMALLGAYFGEARVFHELNGRGHLNDLADLEPEEMVAEALAR